MIAATQGSANMRRLLLALAIVVAFLAPSAPMASAATPTATWLCPQTPLVDFPRTAAVGNCQVDLFGTSLKVTCKATDQRLDKLKVRVTVTHKGSGTVLATCSLSSDSRNATVTASKNRSKPSKWKGTPDVTNASWTLVVKVELIDSKKAVALSTTVEYTVPVGYPPYL